LTKSEHANNESLAVTPRAERSKKTARKRRDLTVPVMCLALVLSVVAIVCHLKQTQSDLIHTTAIRDAEQYAKTLITFRSLYTSEVVIPAKKAGVNITHNYHETEGATPLPATLSMRLGRELGSEGAQARNSIAPIPFLGGKRPVVSQMTLRKMLGKRYKTILKYLLPSLKKSMVKTYFDTQ
jgi:hypothetical protein